MAVPYLIGAGSTIYDTQVVYTSSGPGVGTFGILDGRGFVWCSHSGSSTLTRGEPLVSSVPVYAENLATSTSAFGIGQTLITGVTANTEAIPVNAFAGGLMVVVDGAGEATSYRIRDHSAISASSANGRIILIDPIVIASDANTEVTFVPSKYANPQQSQPVGSYSFVGVPLVDVPDGSTTTQFFWAQRLGYCPAFIEGTPRRGTSVVISRRTAGRFASVKDSIEVNIPHDGGGTAHVDLDRTPVIGQMVTNAIDGEVQIVDLQQTLF